MKSYLYLLFSILLTAGCMWYCNYEKPSLFGIDFSFSTSQLFVPVMANLLIAIYFNFLTIFKSIYIGVINDQEKEHIISSVKNDIFGLFFSIVYLKDAFSVSAIYPIAVWIYLSYSAYLLEARIKTYIMNPLSTPRLVRLWCGIISHTALSIIWLCINHKQLLHYFPHYSALNLLMWSYSITFTLQSICMIEQSLLIPLKNQDIISEHAFSIGSLLINLLYNALLVMNYLFYMTINTDYDSVIDMVLGYPSYEVIFALNALRKDIMNLYGFIKFRSSLDHDYARPSEDDLERSPDCVVCRDHNDAQTSRVMPCGHVFHEDCLKSWIMQKQNCPICNKSLFDFTQEKSSFLSPEEEQLKQAMKQETVQNMIQSIQMMNVVNMTKYAQAFHIPEDEIDYWCQEALEFQKKYSPAIGKKDVNTFIGESLVDYMKKQKAMEAMKEEIPMVVGEWNYEVEEKIPDLIEMKEEDMVDDWNSQELVTETETETEDEIDEEEEKSQTMQEFEGIPENLDGQQDQIIHDENKNSIDKQEDSIPPDQQQPIRVLTNDELRQRRLLYLSRSSSSMRKEEEEEEDKKEK